MLPIFLSFKFFPNFSKLIVTCQDCEILHFFHLILRWQGNVGDCWLEDEARAMLEVETHQEVLLALGLTAAILGHMNLLFWGSLVLSLAFL